MHPETIAPGICLADGTTVTPTGHEWLLLFALGGCQWAIDQIHEIEEKERALSRPPPNNRSIILS